MPRLDPHLHPVDALKQWLTAAGLAHQIDPEQEQALRAMCDATD